MMQADYSEQLCGKHCGSTTVQRPQRAFELQEVIDNLIPQPHQAGQILFTSWPSADWIREHPDLR